jgi:hypothetical protein
MGTSESVTKRIIVVPTEPLSLVVTARQGIFIHQIGVHLKWHKVLPPSNPLASSVYLRKGTFL